MDAATARKNTPLKEKGEESKRNRAVTNLPSLFPPWVALGET